jgi:[ribosomal protein S5]-alanine N-acetyltransferase
MTEPSVPAPTARLIAFGPEPEAQPFAKLLFADPRVTALVGGPCDEAGVAARLAAELANQRDHGIAYWPILLYGSKEIGCCGLKPRVSPRGGPLYELGFYLLPPYWGQGFAAEAGASVVAYAFDVLGATSLFAGHHPDNHGSKTALEKLGFRYTHHELYPPTGLEHPGYELIRKPTEPESDPDESG